MSRFSAFKAMAVSSAIAILAACSEVPSPQVPHAVSAQSVAKPPAPGSNQPKKVEIVYAQLGLVLTETGLIKQTVQVVDKGQAFYALGVFKGTDSIKSVAEIRVLDAKNNALYSARKSFKPNGETPVAFQVKPTDVVLVPGEYRIFFDLNGVPCWELLLTVK